MSITDTRVRPCASPEGLPTRIRFRALERSGVGMVRHPRDVWLPTARLRLTATATRT